MRCLLSDRSKDNSTVTRFFAEYANFAYPTFIHRTGIPKRIGRSQRRCKEIKLRWPVWWAFIGNPEFTMLDCVRQSSISGATARLDGLHAGLCDAFSSDIRWPYMYCRRRVCGDISDTTWWRRRQRYDPTTRLQSDAAARHFLQSTAGSRTVHGTVRSSAATLCHSRYTVARPTGSFLPRDAAELARVPYWSTPAHCFRPWHSLRVANRSHENLTKIFAENFIGNFMAFW